MPGCTRRIPFVADQEAYHQHFGQCGGSLPIFRGLSHQDGYGIGGGIFSNIFKAFVPVLKKTAKSAGKTLLKTGTQVLSDVVSGERDIKNALQHRGLEALDEVGAKVKKKLVKDVLRAGESTSSGARPLKRQRQALAKGRRSKRRRQGGGGGDLTFFQ